MILNRNIAKAKSMKDRIDNFLLDLVILCSKLLCSEVVIVASKKIKKFILKLPLMNFHNVIIG